MDLQEYVSILRRVPSAAYHQPDTALRLTLDDIGLLCPHLTRYELEQLWQEKKRYNGNRLLVALPPISMQRPGLYLGFNPTSNYPYDMLVGSIHWIPESVPFFDAAFLFARENWPEALIAEEVKGVCDFSLWRVDDPEWGHQTHVLSVSGAMRMTRAEIAAESATTPSHEVLERAIISLSTDSLVRSENFGVARSYRNQMCAHCGFGFSYSRCTNCERMFQENLWRKWRYAAIPQSVLQLALAQGHTFDIEPSIGWERDQTLAQSGNDQVLGLDTVMVSFG